MRIDDADRWRIGWTFSLLFHATLVFALGCVTWSPSDSADRLTAPLDAPAPLFAKGETASVVRVQLVMPQKVVADDPTPPTPLAKRDDAEPTPNEPVKPEPEPTPLAEAPRASTTHTFAPPVLCEPIAHDDTPSPHAKMHLYVNDAPADHEPQSLAQLVAPHLPSPIEGGEERVTYPVAAVDSPIDRAWLPRPVEPRIAAAQPAAPAVCAADPVSTPDAKAGVETGVEVARMPHPKYPAESLRRRETGTVLLRLQVGVDGAATLVAVVKDPGYERLVSAAIEAVQKARFRPATRGGQPVVAVVDLPVVFVLR
jgi:TonB family protein